LPRPAGAAFPPPEGVDFLGIVLLGPSPRTVACFDSVPSRERPPQKRRRRRRAPSRPCGAALPAAHARPFRNDRGTRPGSSIVSTVGKVKEEEPRRGWASRRRTPPRTALAPDERRAGNPAPPPVRAGKPVAGDLVRDRPVEGRDQGRSSSTGRAPGRRRCRGVAAGSGRSRKPGAGSSVLPGTACGASDYIRSAWITICFWAGVNSSLIFRKVFTLLSRRSVARSVIFITILFTSSESGATPMARTSRRSMSW